MQSMDPTFHNYIKQETMTDEPKPLDLTYRCSSVGTSSGSGSPPFETSPTKNHHDGLPIYQANHLLHPRPHHQPLPGFTTSYSCAKHDSPSPDMTSLYPKIHQQATHPVTSYMLHAAALQQNIRLSRHTPPTEDDSSGSVMFNAYPLQMVGRDGKLSRPFKAYPRDPVSLASFSVVNTESAEKFDVFRKQMLKHIHEANGGQPTVSNPKMRRTTSRAGSISQAGSTNKVDNEANPNNNTEEINGCVKDKLYYERRKKNNAAAKKSRDRRRIKEDEIAIRATFLERENNELRAELLSSRNQLTEQKMEINSLHKKLAKLASN